MFIESGRLRSGQFRDFGVQPHGMGHDLRRGLIAPVFILLFLLLLFLPKLLIL
jgi:hypothetical protein